MLRNAVLSLSGLAAVSRISVFSQSKHESSAHDRAQIDLPLNNLRDGKQETI